MGAIAYNADRATPTQYDCASPSSELEQTLPAEPYNNTMPQEMNGASSDNPLMSSLLPGPPPQAVQLMPPGLWGRSHRSLLSRVAFAPPSFGLYHEYLH
jgi:hypothetical protein